MLTLVVVVTTRKLMPCFLGHRIFVKIYYPKCHDLKKPDLAERMVSWAVRLSKYNLQYITRGNIKSHVLANFLGKFNTPISEDIPLHGSFQWT